MPAANWKLSRSGYSRVTLATKFELELHGVRSGKIHAGTVQEYMLVKLLLLLVSEAARFQCQQPLRS